MALWQVIAWLISPGSCLAAVRLAQTQATCDILGIKESFNEEHLYHNLSWLATNQLKIEKRLFQERTRKSNKKSELFLYDVTSSYLEGLANELAAWGYNRDKKTGKKQVVVGLLCDEEGDPVAVEVFTGNTSDFATLESQIKKLAQEFNCQRITMVGDRGMIKKEQIAELASAGFHYITAITKPQLKRSLRIGVF